MPLLRPWCKTRPGSHGNVQPGWGLLLGNLLFGAVGIDNAGVIQLLLQIAGDGINVDPSEFVTLCQFLFGQTFSFVLLGQFIDSGDDFIHVHVSTSYIAVDDHRNSVLFCPSVDGMEFDFTETPDGNFHAFRNLLVGLFTGKTVDGGLACQYVNSGKAAIDGLPCEKPDKVIAEGSKISVRGLGKIKLVQINGKTKKDRISVVIHRYI